MSRLTLLPCARFSYNSATQLIELLTGLHPIMARECIDENVFEDIPELIQQHHDGKAQPGMAITDLDTPTSLKCKWPPAILAKMALIAAKCSRPQGKLRSTIASVLPELDQMLADAATDAAAASD